MGTKRHGSMWYSCRLLFGFACGMALVFGPLSFSDHRPRRRPVRGHGVSMESPLSSGSERSIPSRAPTRRTAWRCHLTSTRTTRSSRTPAPGIRLPSSSPEARCSSTACPVYLSPFVWLSARALLDQESHRCRRRDREMGWLGVVDGAKPAVIRSQRLAQQRVVSQRVTLFRCRTGQHRWRVR